MWYAETEKEVLDLTKPICATCADGSVTYLLIPSNVDGTYMFRGYDWFNPVTGKYNSCKNFATVEEATKSYSNVRNCNVRNCNISIDY